MFRIKKLWMGPDEKVFNEGFESLFKVAEDYKIPPPSNEVKQQLDTMAAETKVQPAKESGFDIAMDSVFGSGKKQQQMQAAAVDQAPMNASQKPSIPLQVVQNGASPVNIVVVEPRSFEDSLEIVNHLKERKSVIVNLQYLDPEVSQRVIDFVSGATLSLDGTQERIGHGVFIFASMNCQVQTESDAARAYKDLFARSMA